MSMSLFYRAQAEAQRHTADSAQLQNVRDRAERAAKAWNELALRDERADDLRAEGLAAKQAERLLVGLNENPDRRTAKA